MTYTPETAHADTAVELLISQFENATQLQALIRACMVPVQTLEDEIAELYSVLDLDAATGSLLDLAGAILAEPRNGRPDDLYRLWLKALIRARRSNGTGDAVQEVVRTALGSMGHVLELTTLPPASYRLHVGALALSLSAYPSLSAPEVAAALIDLLEIASAAGVRVMLTYQSAADAASFSFASGDASEASTAQGCADDDQTQGGDLADVEQA